MFKTLRENRECILKLKGLCTDNKIPMGLLMEGGEVIKDATKAFEIVKNYDSKNEKHPFD